MNALSAAAGLVAVNSTNPDKKAEFTQPEDVDSDFTTFDAEFLFNHRMGNAADFKSEHQDLVRRRTESHEPLWQSWIHSSFGSEGTTTIL